MNQVKLFTISAYTENYPGVLHRLATSFTKRKINIESMTVSETSEKGISLFTITAYINEAIVPTIVKQLQRIIEVRKVFASRDTDLVFSEVSLIRVELKDIKIISEIERIVEKHNNASIVFVDDESVIIQCIGSEDENNIIYKLLKPFGVLQLARSGRIALRKKFESIYGNK